MNHWIEKYKSEDSILKKSIESTIRACFSVAKEEPDIENGNEFIDLGDGKGEA